MKRESVERGELKNPTRFADSLCRSMCRKIVPMLQALLLRCAAKALRDNEPSGSHPRFHAKKKQPWRAAFLRKDRDSFFAALRKRYAITNPRVLIPAFTQKKATLASCFFAERQGFFLRCAAKALRDNEPSGSHPCFHAKKATLAGCFFAERQVPFLTRLSR